MVDVGLDSQDALDLLVAAPGTKEEKQEFFDDQFEVRVPKTNYDLMWDRLVEELGEDEGANAVAALVLSSTDSRAIQLLGRAASGRSVSLRMDEPALVELLFEADGDLTAIGEALVDELRQRTAQVAEPPVQPRMPTEVPLPSAPVPRRVPPPTEGADVILDWRFARPDSPDHGSWRWSGCLYAYIHPVTQKVLYIGKTADLTVRQRFISNFKRKFNDLYARLGILNVEVIAAQIELRVSSRLTGLWLDDLESLLILRIQPQLNKSKRKSRSNTRPGTVVVCTGDWPLASARFVDKG